MKQSLNTKWSKPQHINEKRIQIGEAISETEFYCVHKAPYNSFFIYFPCTDRKQLRFHYIYIDKGLSLI